MSFVFNLTGVLFAFGCASRGASPGSRVCIESPQQVAIIDETDEEAVPSYDEGPICWRQETLTVCRLNQFKVLFETGTSDARSSMEWLPRVTDVLHEHPATLLRIEGYALAEVEKNPVALAKSRADALKQMLLVAGISADRIDDMVKHRVIEFDVPAEFQSWFESAGVSIIGDAVLRDSDWTPL